MGGIYMKRFSILFLVMIERKLHTEQFETHTDRLDLVLPAHKYFRLHQGNQLYMLGLLLIEST